MKSKKTHSLLLTQVGIKIKTIRLSKGISQTQLSLICDMEKSSVSRIEAGMVNLSLITLYRLCEGLEVTLKDLFNTAS